MGGDDLIYLYFIAAILCILWLHDSKEGEG